MNVQLLAVTGNNGSGKSTLAIKTACELNRRNIKTGRSTVYVSCDMRLSSMSLVSCRSRRYLLSGLLKNKKLTEKEILSDMAFVSGNLGFLSLNPGERISSVSSADYTERFNNLLTGLRMVFDSIILDCTSFECDELLSSADCIISAVSGNVRGINYTVARADAVYRYGSKLITVLSDCMPYHPADEVSSILKAKYILPHSEEIDRQYCCGELTNRLSSPTGKKYTVIVNRLIDEIFFNNSGESR